MRRSVGVVILCGITACTIATSSQTLPLRLNLSFFGLFGGKAQPPPGWMLRKQSVSLGKTDLKPAERHCENWSWVAGVTDMAEAGGARIDQQYLVDRLYGGSVCLSSVGDIADLAQRISHDYVLPDGQRFRLDAQFTAGAPSQADPLIVAMRQNRPLMLIWRNHSYLLTGMAYDEYIAPTGNRMFMVQSLTLFDPDGDEGKREVAFVRDRDNPDDLNGLIELFIYPK